MENAKSIRQKLERDFENLRIKIYSRRNDVASIKKCITEGICSLTLSCLSVYMYTPLFMCN